jgi:hypothetical protein
MEIAPGIAAGKWQALRLDDRDSPDWPATVRIPPTFVAQTRAPESSGPGRAPLADPVASHQVVHDFALLDGL